MLQMSHAVEILICAGARRYLSLPVRRSTAPPAPFGAPRRRFGVLFLSCGPCMPGLLLALDASCCSDDDSLAGGHAFHVVLSRQQLSRQGDRARPSLAYQLSREWDIAARPCGAPCLLFPCSGLAVRPGGRALRLGVSFDWRSRNDETRPRPWLAQDRLARGAYLRI